MCQICNKEIDRIWNDLAEGHVYRTPDRINGVDFKIEEKATDKIKIKPQNISISKKSFLATVHYLLKNKHFEKKPCEIGSSNSRPKSGPLCIVSRDQSSNVRCINYILPILQKNQVVGIDSARPNKTWLLI